MVKKNKPLIERNDIFSIFALLISLISLGFSWFIYSQSNKEKVSIIIEPDRSNYITAIDTTISILPIITAQWVIVLSNIGDKSLTIVNYDLWEIDSNNDLGTYSTIDKGIFDENNVRVSLPIDIEPGKSKKFLMKTGLKMDGSIGAILKKVHFMKGPIGMKTLTDTLLRRNTDIFGNKIETTYYKNKFVSARWDSCKETINNLKITTAKGSNFYQNMEWYPIFNRQ